MTGSNQLKDYVSRRRDGASSLRPGKILLPVAICVVVLAGCGGSSPAVITALDGSFSNYEVAPKCLSDLDRAARLAADQGSSFTFFSYDGDPLGRRGVAVDFGAKEIPNRYKGTEKEGEWRVEHSGPVLEEMRNLAEDRPEEGGTPLLGVLTRIARIAHGLGSVPKYVVNCGDGLWTDLKPGMSEREIQALAREIPPGLEGTTIDFVGLDASALGTGSWIERLRPLVKQVLEYKHAHLGVYDIELPANWPEGS